jgi:hypothetical protein
MLHTQKWAPNFDGCIPMTGTLFSVSIGYTQNGGLYELLMAKNFSV